MTSVNITTTKNTVTVNGETSVVTVTTQGAQGIQGVAGNDGTDATVDTASVDAAGAVMNTDTTTAAMSFVVDEDNMSSDSATKVPTQQSVKAYVDTEVSGIVNSAPAALDTLNELAAALGDDANFSTTVSNSIGTKLPLGGGTMTGDIVMSGSETVDGRDLSVDGAKLDGIESGAKDDQTAAEIKTLLQSDKLTVSEIADDAITADKLANSINTEIAANTAKVSNATHTGDVTGSTALTIADDAVTYAKMQDVSATDRVLGRDSSGAGVVEEITPANLRTMINVEDGATADQTDAEIKTAYENNSDTNAFTDAEKTKLSGVEANATADQTDEEIQDIVGAMLTGNTESGITVTYQDADGTIDFAVASQTDENFTTADHSKLDGIESNATADQTGAEIKSLYEGESDTNAFTDADHTKLDGIEASADVTDATNVAAAGALMDGDFTSNGFLKRTGAGSYTVDTSTYLENLNDDTSPQLGGSLDVNGQDIVTTSNGDIELAPNGTGKTILKGNTNAGTLVFNCENNSHGQTVKAQPHSASVTNVLTLPAGADQEIVGTLATQTLTNKTLTSAVLNTGISGSAILDEDNMASNSATQLATQQSIKAYVDAEVAGAGGGGVTVQDEGSALSTTGTTLNFVGAGVTASGTGATKTITISGGGGGSGLSRAASTALVLIFN